MSHIRGIDIKNFRGIKHLGQNFGDEKFIVLIGRGDSGKSTILTAIQYALSPSWNIVFSDLDFYNQDLTNPIEIQILVTELPKELLRESKFGMYVINPLNKDCTENDLGIIIKLKVDETLEPQWSVVSRIPEIEGKTISAADRALVGINFIGDYTDTQFAYNRQSPLYALTKNGLDDNQDLEKIKVKLLRSISSKVEDEHFEPFNL